MLFTLLGACFGCIIVLYCMHITGKVNICVLCMLLAVGFCRDQFVSTIATETPVDTEVRWLCNSADAVYAV